MPKLSLWKSCFIFNIWQIWLVNLTGVAGAPPSERQLVDYDPTTQIKTSILATLFSICAWRRPLHIWTPEGGNLVFFLAPLRLPDWQSWWYFSYNSTGISTHLNLRNMIIFLPGTPQLLVELFVGNEGEIFPWTGEK